MSELSTISAEVARQAAALREPFPDEQVEQISKGSFTADYVSHAHVTERLLSVDPTYTFAPLIDAQGFPVVVTAGLQKGDAVGVWGRLSVLGVDVVEFCGGADLMSAYSRCLCRCAMRRGVALDLWMKDDGRQQQTPVEGRSPSPRVGASPQETPTSSSAGFPLPTNWEQVQEAIKPYGRDTVDDFNAFGTQARDYLYPEAQGVGLSGAQSTELRKVAAKAAQWLRDNRNPELFPPPGRLSLSLAWSDALELPVGMELEGPPWRMSPDETERPMREEAE